MSSHCSFTLFRIAYVEMAEKRSIPLALQLSGQPLMNQAVLVTETQAEKNRAAGTMTLVYILMCPLLDL